MVSDAQDKIKFIVKSLKDIKKEVASCKEERDVLSAEQQQILREKTKLDLQIRDLQDEVQGDNTSKVILSIKIHLKSLMFKV